MVLAPLGGRPVGFGTDMSTQTLAPEARRNVVLFSGANFGFNAPGVVKFKKKVGDKTVLVLQKVPVFRSGTFRDSMGFQHTWDDIHMQQMVNHWNLLRDRKILESVPVRKGHGGFLADPMDTLIGWHTDLVTEKRANPIDSKEYTYLDADFEILDPAAQDAIDSGLWKNLSAEISSYVTNDEMEFWPVYSGVAYVDFSAVEGLREFSKNSKFSLMFENESEAPAVVPADNNNGPAGQGTSGTGAGQTQTTPPGQAAPPADGQQQTTPPGQAAPPADGNVGQQQTGQVQDDDTTDTGADGADHTKGGTLFVFKLNGQPGVGIPIQGLSAQQYQAFMGAQAHIDGLEQYRTEQIKGSREDFVKGLASKNVILASDIPELTVAALEMSDSAFAKWSAVYNKMSAPSSNTQLFDQHGAQPQGDSNHNQSGQQVAADDLQEQIDIQEAIVADHRRSGWSKEKVEGTGSYQKLQALLAQQKTNTQS